ncbi:MAG: 30S ribosomal protein S7 [Candidatus Omnitrophota bacterium]|jgi:small subunit ribosomal protein S7
MRRRGAQDREVMPDPKYNSKVVSKFINMVMLRGEKSTAQNIVYGALEILSQKANEADVLQVFHKALDNVRPHLEVKSRRIGGATYQVPIEVNKERGISLALRWVRDIAQSKKGRPMQEKLADELLSAYKGEGTAIKKRDDLHKMAEANRAFAHFRW